MILDIIVPHYNEPLSKCKYFLHMIDAQRGIDFNDIRVIIVQDGQTEHGPEFVQYVRNNKWNFTVIVKHIGHSGVSVARNVGLEVSCAKWVIFCDSDDSFSSIYSLKQILDLLNEPVSDDYDLLWMPFHIEQPVKDGPNGALDVHPSKQNNVFIHGKLFRREFLMKHNIRFCPDLFFSEDSAFCTDVDIAIDHTRIGTIKSNDLLYAWIYSKNSETTNPDNYYRNIFGLFLRHKYVVERFYKSGKMFDFRAMVARTVTDYYYQFTRNNLPDSFRNDLYADYTEFFNEYSAAYYANTPDVVEKCLHATLNEAVKSDDFTAPTITFAEWATNNIPPVQNQKGGDQNA